jgi:hypothetical protein
MGSLLVVSGDILKSASIAGKGQNVEEAFMKCVGRGTPMHTDAAPDLKMNQ